MVVDINVFYTFNMGDNIKVNCIDGWRHCAWQGQLDGGDHGGRWHHDVSHKLESLVINRPLLATHLLHLYDVMNLGIIKHIEAVKHWNALTISTAYHIPVFIEEHSNWSDTSWCHQPLWSPPSNYPCHPQCRQPSTHMFRLSHWLKVKKLMSTTITAAFQIQVEENSNRSDTSGCLQSPGSSPPNCPCHPWCRRAPTLMYLVWSDMLKV